jgi:hypothetical protein
MRAREFQIPTCQKRGNPEPPSIPLAEIATFAYGSSVFEQKNPDIEGRIEDLILVMGNPASHFWHEENFETEPRALFLPEILGTTVELDE